jgi:hypothetical protein
VSPKEQVSNPIRTYGTPPPKVHTVQAISQLLMYPGPKLAAFSICMECGMEWARGRESERDRKKEKEKKSFWQFGHTTTISVSTCFGEIEEQAVLVGGTADADGCTIHADARAARVLEVRAHQVAFVRTREAGRAVAASSDHDGVRVGDGHLAHGAGHVPLVHGRKRRDARSPETGLWDKCVRESERQRQRDRERQRQRREA